jgi:hypothetical protein
MILAVYILFCVITMPILFERDRLMGIIYALLFLYSVFSFIGYLYLPGLSESILAYFGDNVGHVALNFIFLSMVLIFTLNYFLYRPKKLAQSDRGLKISYDRRSQFSLFSISIPYLLIAIFSYLLYQNIDRLSWDNAQQENIDLSLSIFIGIFKMSVGFLIIMYVMMREKCYANYKRLLTPFVVYLFLFFLSSFLLGNRTDPAALVVGILFYESSKQKLNVRLILKSMGLISLAIILLSVIEFFRYENNYSVATLAERIVRNDYFAPAHMLFASIAYGLVDFGEVFRSNFNNAMILQYYPYLQETVTDLFNEGVATRSAGYAFYVLSEGYIAFGFWGGIFYNAVVVTLFVKLWNSFAATDSRFVNLLIKTLLATMCINVVRSQSSQFIKITYTYFIPVMIVDVRALPPFSRP